MIRTLERRQSVAKEWERKGKEQDVVATASDDGGSDGYDDC